MATRHDKLSGEELDRQRALDRSWESAQRLLGDDQFRRHLEVSIEHVQSSEAEPVTADEFLALTQLDD